MFFIAGFSNLSKGVISSDFLGFEVLNLFKVFVLAFDETIFDSFSLLSFVVNLSTMFEMKFLDFCFVWPRLFVIYWVGSAMAV